MSKAIPAHTDGGKNPVLMGAYHSFLRWAITDPDVLARFERETGKRFMLSKPGDPLAALIDKACGTDDHNHKVMGEFIEWATVNLWGTQADEESEES